MAFAGWSWAEFNQNHWDYETNGNYFAGAKTKTVNQSSTKRNHILLRLSIIRLPSYRFVWWNADNIFIFEVGFECAREREMRKGDKEEEKLRCRNCSVRGKKKDEQSAFNFIPLRPLALPDGQIRQFPFPRSVIRLFLVSRPRNFGNRSGEFCVTVTMF